MLDTVLLVSAASAVGDRAYKDGAFWVASLRYLVTPRRRRRFEASTQSAAGSPLFTASQRENVFPASVFLRSQIKRRARAVFAPDQRFARTISTDVMRPQASKWADPKGVIPGLAD
jgi:hypothetical protein